MTFTSSAFLTAALPCKYVCIYVQKLTQAIIFRLGGKKGWVLYLYSISLLNNGMGVGVGLGELTSKSWFYWSVVFEVVSVVAFAGSESLSGCYMCVPRKGPQRGEVWDW